MAALACGGQLANSSGVPYSGAKVYVYLKNTSTPATIYSDDGLSVEETNPIVADSLGVLKFYVDDSIDQDIIVKTSDDATTLQARTEITATGRNFIPMFSFGAAEALTPISANITTVAGIAANVTTVAGDSAAVQQVSADTTPINYIYNNRSILEDLTGAYSNPETVAAMLSVSEGTLSDGKVYYPRGFASPLDVPDIPGFEWDATSTETANDLTIIEHATALTGRFKMRVPANGEVKAEWFGIDPDASGGTGTDWTDTLNALLALSDIRSVEIGIGDTLVTDTISLPNRTRLTSSNRLACRLYANTNFNMAAGAIVDLGTSEPSAQLVDISIYARQTLTETVRGNLVQYPPMVRSLYPRALIKNVRLAGGLVGISFTGNSGGSIIDGFCEIGCFERAVEVDGSLGFISVDIVHSWPYEFAAFNIADIYYDGTTRVMYMGDCDGFNARSILAFRASLETTATATQNIAHQILNLGLDGDNARLIASGYSNTQISNFYTTKSATATGDCVEVSGNARLMISNLSIVGAGGVNVDVSGGFFKATGGYMSKTVTSEEFVTASGGRTILQNIHFQIPSSTRTAAVVEQSSTGNLVMTGCTFSKTGANFEGVTIGADLEGNFIQGNDFGDWPYTLPSDITDGTYGSNRHAGIAWTPSLSFTTVGDSVLTVTGGSAEYWPTANGFKLQARLLFTTNAYTTGSGIFRVSGYPSSTPGGVDSAPLAIGGMSNIDLSAGFSGVQPIVDKTSGDILFRQSGDAATLINLTQASLPASGSFEIGFSGEFITK